jgi:hypothetical protein
MGGPAREVAGERAERRTPTCPDRVRSLSEPVEPDVRPPTEAAEQSRQRHPGEARTVGPFSMDA